MYKNLIGILALTCAFVISPTAFANSGFCGEGLGKMVESLKLDDSQKEKIKPILESLKTNLKQGGDQMRDLSKQLSEQATSGSTDQTAANDLIDKKAKLIGDMMKAKFMAKSQIYSVLNTEQKTQLQDKMKELEEKLAAKFKDCQDE